MRFPEPLVPGVLLRRYKRFLADVRLQDGSELTVHCANPGAMSGSATPGFRVLLSRCPRPGRKLSHTLELVHNGACWIGVNTGLANAVVEEALRYGSLPGLQGYSGLRREAAYGAEGSRVDFLLTGNRGVCYLEVKSVTLLAADGRYAFPDAVTTRGLRHLRELAAMVRAGHRAVLLFLILRSDGAGGFRAAWEVDPAYARGLEAAADSGVEVLPCLAQVGAEGITVEDGMPVLPWHRPRE